MISLHHICNGIQFHPDLKFRFQVFCLVGLLVANAIQITVSHNGVQFCAGCLMGDDWCLEITFEILDVFIDIAGELCK